MKWGIAASAVAIVGATLSNPVTVIAADTVAFGPVPNWVEPQKAPETLPNPAGSAVRILLSDQQLNLAPSLSEQYVDSVILIQTPQGLSQAGNVVLAWRPDTDVVTVHKLTVSRGGKVIDLLASGQKFTVIRREDQLEYAILSGVLTAFLQPEGLQVGDRLELAYTLRRQDSLLGGVPEAALVIAPGAAVVRAHLSARWPAGYQMTWKASPWLTGVQQRRSGNFIEVSATYENVDPLVQPAFAPSRFAALRMMQLSGRTSWNDISRVMYPLFEHASHISRSSLLQKEIARIRMQTPDPRGRALAALRLVQDQVRYVFVGLNDARLVPADVDTTWSRRYGDCKAKTALLLGLLGELGIPAQAVAVSTLGGDALPTRLPMVSLFNHVLVRAMIDGTTYWLDGTRLGDRQLDTAPHVNFVWGLPLTRSGDSLIAANAQPLALPMSDSTIDVDATAGPTARASFHAETLLRSDAAILAQSTLARLTDAQRDQAVRKYWSQQAYWSNNWNELTIHAVKADFDDANGTLRLSMDGDGIMNWQGDEHLIGAVDIGAVVDLKRPDGPNRDAPYLTAFPSYTHAIEHIKLPNKGVGFAVIGDDVDQTIAGVHYIRKASIAGGVLTAEASARSLVAEFPASEASAAQVALHALWDHSVYAKLPSASDALDRGNQLMDHGQYAAAIAAFNDALSIDPQNVSALADRGLAYIWNNDIEDGKKDILAAAAIDPHDRTVLHGQGLLALRTRDLASAVRAFTGALGVDPRDGFAFQMRAESYLYLRQSAKADSDLSAAARLLPNDTYLYWLRALAAWQERKLPEGLRQAELVVKAKPHDAYAYLLAGDIYALFKRPAPALHAFDRAIAISPSEAEYLARETERPMSDLAGKRADMAAAVKLDPRSARDQASLAQLDSDMGHYMDAIAEFSGAIEISGENAALLTRRGVAYAKSAQTTLAQKDLARARALAETPSALNDVCWTLATADVDLTGALAACRAAVSQTKGPQSVDYLDSLGFVLLRLDRCKEAIAAYDHALTIKPLLPTSLYGRGICERRTGDLQAAHDDMRSGALFSNTVAGDFARYGIKP